MIAGIIGIGITVVLSIIAAMAVPVFNRVQEKAKAVAAAAAARPKLPPLTAAQKASATKFGRLLVVAINSRSEASLEEMTDLETFADRTLAGLYGPESSFRTGYLKGLKKNKGGLMAQMLGTRPKLLRVTERDGYPALTVRLTTDRGGVNYVDFLIRPAGESFKVVDIFTYLYGMMGSEDSRQAIVLLQNQNPGLAALVLGLKTASKADGEALLSFMTNLKKHDYKTDVKAYEALPPALRRSRTAYIAYLTTLQHLIDQPDYDKAYQTALESATDILGPDSATDLLLFDLNLMKKNYKAAQQGIARVLLKVGDDAKLYQMEGVAAIRAHDLEAAERCLAAGEKLEPDLVDLVDLHLQVAAMKGDFAGVVAELRRFTAVNRVSIKPEALKEEVYAEFKKSPEFAAWAKGAR